MTTANWPRVGACVLDRTKRLLHVRAAALRIELTKKRSELARPVVAAQTSKKKREWRMVRVVIIEEAHHHLAHEFREKLLLQVERPERLQGQLDRGRLIRVDLDHRHGDVNYWKYPKKQK
jgi:hypothetical protein